MSEWSDNFSNKWGLLLDYGLRWPLSTSISEGGLGHEMALSFTVNPRLEDRYLFKLSFPWGDTQGKLFTSTDVAGTFTENSHIGGAFGIGRHHRMAPFFTDSGRMWGAFFSATIPSVGVSQFTSGMPDRVVGGEEFTFGDESVYTFDASTQFLFGMEFIPTNHFHLQIAPALNYGVKFHEEGSEWNRVILEFMLMASIGYGDNSYLSLRPEPEATSLEIAYRSYAQLHGIVQGILMNKALNEMAGRISDFGLTFGEGDPGSTEDLRFLQGATAFMGGMGQAGAQAYFLRIGGWNWLPMVLEALGGITVMAAGQGESGLAGGTGSLLNAAGMSIYMMWGVDTPAERTALTDEDKELHPPLLSVALVRNALNTATFLVGALLVNSDAESDAGWALLGGGAQANFGVAFNPDPADTHTVVRTSYSYIPATYYHVGDDSGSRSGFMITNSVRDWPVYWETKFLSHALRLDNVGRRFGADPGGPYGDAFLSSEVVATVGAHYEMTWFRIGGGLDTAILYGSGMGATGALGLSAGMDVIIPFNGQPNGTGLTLGVRGSLHKLLPSGWDYEVAPHLGLTAHF